MLNMSTYIICELTVVMKETYPGQLSGSLSLPEQVAAPSVDLVRDDPTSD